MSHPAAVAFAGRMGSGKSLISSALALEMKWRRASFGDFVRSVAEKRGLEPTRQILQEIGAELESDDAALFCHEVLSFAGWSVGESIVIDGVRHVRILETLGKLIAPMPLLFVYLDSEEESRRSRLLQRDQVDSTSLSAVESHSTERDVVSRLPELADIRLSNLDGSEQELLQRIQERIRAIA